VRSAQRAQALGTKAERSQSMTRSKTNLVLRNSVGQRVASGLLCSVLYVEIKRHQWGNCRAAMVVALRRSKRDRSDS
jgi:hypothetical protein